MDEEEYLARILCKVMGEDPDEIVIPKKCDLVDKEPTSFLEKIFGAGKKLEIIDDPSKSPHPMWQYYSEESRKYIAARSYFESVSDTISQKKKPVKKVTRAPRKTNG